METLSSWFWNERVWLPENYSWADVQPIQNPHNLTTQFTKFGDLVYPFLIGIFLIPLRWLVEKHFLKNVGLSLGLTSKFGAKFSPLNNNKHDNGHRRPAKLQKFTESGWRFLCYGSLWIFGLITLVNKSWFWNTQHCWIEYPCHEIDTDIWWYYTLSTSFYWSLFLSQFSDVKRKDFWQMCLHHVLTIGLLSFSWVTNLTRMGSLIILVHDTADVFLEIGKMTKYAGWHKTCDLIFVLFTILWVLTRLVIYPIHILRSTLFESKSMHNIFPVYYILNGMLLTLLILHVFWTYFIFRVAVSAVSKGKYEDSRSSSEDDDDVVDEATNKRD